MATQKGFLGVLPAVKKCFAIAGQNIKNIMQVANKETSNYTDYMGKFNKALEFAEQVATKIKSDPLKYDV